MSLPGWDSLDTASHIHDAAEIAGIVFLALLVVAEVCRFSYSVRIKELETAALRRALTPEQRDTLIGGLSPFRGQKIAVVCVLGDGEAKRFAEDFVAVFLNAGWDFRAPPGAKPGVDQAAYDRDPIGIEPTINQSEAEAGTIPAGFVALAKTLYELHLIKERKVFK